jgi:hypothetical protein
MPKRPRKQQTDSNAHEAPDVPPQEFDARAYQQDFLDAMQGRTVEATGGLDAKGRFVGCNGWERARGRCKRALVVWHRRAGKDRTGLELIRDGIDTRVGAYWHLYPLQVQAEKAIWNAVDPQTETRLLDLVFPPAMVEYSNDSKMFKRFRNEATYQLCGSDKYDRLVGSNTVGVLFSEWALCDPRAWPYIMPPHLPARRHARCRSGPCRTSLRRGSAAHHGGRRPPARP